MRKLLLATAATMGALLVTVGGAQAQPVTPVAPGTIAVHLNGYLQFGIGYFGSSANTASVSVPSTTPGGTATTGTAKLNPYNTIGDARLYSGFDAQTLNGIDYGAQIELRTTSSDANTRAGLTTGSAGAAGTESIYVKRAYGYIGTTQAGFVRLGQTDSAFTLLQTGVIEGYGDGAQFNSDGGIFNAIPSAAEPALFIYADNSHLYSTDKVVYLSPTIAGFSGAAGFEPSSDGLKEGTGNCANAGSSAINPFGITAAAPASGSTPASTGIPAASSTCNDVASSPFTNSSFRRNTIDAALLYAGTFGDFATKANLGFLNGAPIANTQAALASGANRFREMTIYQAGAQTTFGGFTLGANVKGGSVNGSYAFKIAGARNALDYIVGGTYTVGPWVAGVSFLDGQSSGNWNQTNHVGRTLDEYGAAAGGNYVVGKDLSLYVQYEYGHRHQANWNFNAAAAGVGTASGNAQFQTIATGATYKW